MSFVKIKSNNLGVCPYCNSEEIDKGTARFEFDMMYFPCKCEKCGKYFEEWNKLEFAGHNVGSCGEYDAQQKLNKVIEYKEEEK